MADKGRDKDETTADVLRRDPEPTHLQKTYIVVAEASLNTFKNWYKVLKKLPDGDPRQNALRDPAKSVSKVLNKLAGLNHDLDLVKTPGVIAKLLGALDNLVSGLQEYQSTGDESGAPLYATYEQRIMDNRDALRSTFAAYQETGDSEAYKTALRDLSKTLDSIVSETKLVRERPPTPDTPPAQLSPGGAVAASAADVDVSGHSDPEIENIAARRNAYELSASTDRVDPEPRPAPVPTPHTTDKWAMSESESAPARPTAVPGPETPVSDRGDAPTPDARPVEYNLSESRDDGGDPKRLSFPISESGGGGGGGGSQFLLSDSGAPEPIGLSDSGVGGDGDLDGEASSPGGVSEPVATSTPPASRPPIDFVDPRTAAAPVETFSARATYIEGLSRNASVTVDAVNRLEVHVGNNSNLPYIHDDVDLAVWFEGDAGIVEASRIESQGDGSWTVSYRLAAQGGYTCHVRLGGRDGGEDVKNTPFDFVAVDDAPFHTLTNAEVEEVEARDEARDEAREAAINIPTRSSTQPGDIAPRLQPEGMADGTMDDAIPANVAISALVNARNTFRTLDYQAGDLMAVVNGVVRQINELLEKQDVLVTEWKRSEMRRCKIGFEVMDILEVCEAAGVDINTSFFEKPEEFVDIVKRIHAEVYSDGGAESEEHKAAVRAALLREARDIQAATMAAEQQIDKILRGELTEPGRVNDPIQVDVPRFHYMDGAHGGAHHGGGGGGGRHREHGGRHHDEYRYSDEGSDDGSSVVPTARRPQDEMIDLYELARSEIRRMKDAAQRASMKHQLMIARVAQLENELHSRDVSAGEVKSRGPMMPGLGTSKGRGAGGSAASNRNLSWEEREERYQKELDRLSMANAKAKEDARKLAQERDDLRKRLRDATKASNSKLRDAQQANTVYVTDMRRKFENEMRAKNAEIQALLDEKRVQIAELKSALKNRHERELEAVSKKNGVRAATLRNELEELRNVLDDQGAFGLPGGPSPGRRSGRRSGGGRNSHGGGGGGSGGGMASLTRPTKASSGKVRAEQSGGGGGSGAGADSDHSPLARRRDGWKN